MDTIGCLKDLKGLSIYTVSLVKRKKGEKKRDEEGKRREKNLM
jgi:hypothetical protein